MQQSSIDTLESVRHLFTDRSGSAGDVSKVVEVIRAEWEPSYSINMWCDACKLQAIDLAFGRYEEYLRANNGKL